MAWSKTLLELRFRGVTFDCLGTSDDVSRAVVEHVYPYRDGAEVEDLGANAARLTVRTLIFGEDYERQLQEVMAALDVPEAGDLVHPVFGLLRMQVVRYRPVHEAESPDQAQLEIEFVETAPRNPFFDLSLAQADIAAVGMAVDEATAQLSALFSRNMLDIASGGLLSRIEAVRAQMEGYLGQFRSMVNGIQSSGLDLINFPAAFTTDLTRCVQAVQELAFSLFGSGGSTAGNSVAVPGTNSVSSNGFGFTLSSTDQLIRAQQAVSGGASPKATSAQAFAAIAMALKQAMQPLAEGMVPASTLAAYTQDTRAVQVQVHAVVALALADVAGTVFALERTLAAALSAPTQAGNAGMAALLRNGSTSGGATDSSIRAVAVARQGAAALTPDQLENIAALARTELQAVIVDLRALYPRHDPIHLEALKTVAAAVQMACRAALLVRPPMLRRVVEQDSCLPLLAHRWYADHTRSAELQRLNSIPNPNFIARGQVLNAYAR